MEYFGYTAAILMGVSLGIVGGGGSILTVPILIYFFKQPPLVATTTSLLVVGMTAMVGGLRYAWQGQVDLKSGFIFMVPSFLGVYISRNFLLPTIPETLFSVGGFTLTKGALVLLSFAFLMIAVAVSMIRSKKIAVVTDKEPPRFRSIALRGFLVGSLTGFIGAGGGFLIIPALVFLLDLPMRRAVATSLFIITFNSLFGFFISLEGHSFDRSLAFVVAALGVLGLLLGQQVSAKMDERILKKAFGYFVLVIGCFILFEQIAA